MEVFNSWFAVAVCANTQVERERGVKLFTRLFGAATIVEGVGAWQDYREPSLEVRYWFDDNNDDHCQVVRRAIRYARLWQQAAGQTAVFLTAGSPHGQVALVVYQDDWQAAEAELLPIVDRGEWLVQFFENSHNGRQA